MIRPPRLRGAAFSSISEGDLRSYLGNRALFSEGLGISSRWATLHQVHGTRVVEATQPGEQGDADAMYTVMARLPLAVFVADCVPVVIEGEGIVGVAHAGWRGLAAGVVALLRESMEASGRGLLRGAIGPSIGACCYQVGEEVLERFPGFEAATTGGAPSIDLRAAAVAQLDGMEIEIIDLCTYHQGQFSHRRDGTSDRLAAVAWVP